MTVKPFSVLPHTNEELPSNHLKRTQHPKAGGKVSTLIHGDLKGASSCGWPLHFRFLCSASSSIKLIINLSDAECVEYDLPLVQRFHIFFELYNGVF